MGLFGSKQNLTLHSKLKGQSETNVKQPKGMKEEEFILWAKEQIATTPVARIEWHYIVNDKTGEFVYDFSKN